MGWRFSLQDANIVAYLTSKTSNREIVPRIQYSQLWQFLHMLDHSLSYPDQLVFISHKDDWSPVIAEEVQQALARFRRYRERSADIESEHEKDSIQEALDSQQTQFLTPEELRSILTGLRKQFNCFDIYGLPIDRHDGTITKIAETFAIETRERGLFLLPTDPALDHYDRIEHLDFLDPFPAVETLAESNISKPGILFWTNAGSAAYQTDEILLTTYVEKLKKISTDEFASQFKDLTSSGETQRRKIFHLSDLHFGTKHAYENRTRLKGEVRNHRTDCNRVVITGDLFEVINERDAIDFDDFRTDLAEITNKDIVIVPGNHDQRWLGNSFNFVGRHLDKISSLEWTELFIDDENRCIFFCFDSSSESNIAAKGSFSSSQRNAIENKFNTKLRQRPEIEDYFRVTLIHHHPFSFETAQESVVQRGLRFLGVSDERFLSMDNSEALIIWCANMEIPLILHGHKHMQRHFRQEVMNKFGKRVVVEAVGCGASLGAENNPLTYNVVSYNHGSGSFGVTFYEDDLTGGGFAPVKVAVHSMG